MLIDDGVDLVVVPIGEGFFRAIGVVDVVHPAHQVIAGDSATAVEVGVGLGSRSM